MPHDGYQTIQPEFPVCYSNPRSNRNEEIKPAFSSSRLRGKNLIGYREGAKTAKKN